MNIKHFRSIMHFIPDRTRLIPTANSINIILKNTHFPDNLLEDDHGIKLKVMNISGLPVLVFRFTDSSYDFPEPLNYFRLENAENGWLDRDRITIKIQLAETIISDRMHEKVFMLSAEESKSLRNDFNKQKNMTARQTEAAEGDAFSLL